MSNITRLELLREHLIINHNLCKGVVIRSGGGGGGLTKTILEG